MPDPDRQHNPSRLTRAKIPPAKLLFLGAYAGFELARARVLLSRIRPQEVIRRNERVAARNNDLLEARDGTAAQTRCEEMSLAITRMAVRVPWRSDCLVQALAGQNWMARRGIATEIVVGTASGTDGHFEAHAWLTRGSKVLLGGDVDRFQPLLKPDLSRSGERGTRRR